MQPAEKSPMFLFLFFFAFIARRPFTRFSLQKLQLMTFIVRRVGAAQAFPEELALTFCNFSISGQS